MGLTADHKAKISKALKKYHACARKHGCGTQNLTQKKRVVFKSKTTKPIKTKEKEKTKPKTMVKKTFKFKPKPNQTRDIKELKKRVQEQMKDYRKNSKRWWKLWKARGMEVGNRDGREVYDWTDVRDTTIEDELWHLNRERKRAGLIKLTERDIKGKI